MEQDDVVVAFFCSLAIRGGCCCCCCFHVASQKDDVMFSQKKTQIRINQSIKKRTKSVFSLTITFLLPIPILSLSLPLSLPFFLQCFNVQRQAMFFLGGRPVPATATPATTVLHDVIGVAVIVDGRRSGGTRFHLVGRWAGINNNRPAFQIVRQGTRRRRRWWCLTMLLLWLLLLRVVVLVTRTGPDVLVRRGGRRH
jgi:hypothetical protein